MNRGRIAVHGAENESPGKGRQKKGENVVIPQDIYNPDIHKEYPWREHHPCKKVK